MPSPTPLRFGPARLRVVLADEGVAPLDAAIRQLVVDAARDLGVVAEVQELAGFLAGDESVAHRLLVAVQAGVPPDAVLLPGRQAQTARFHAMELVQDVSALMRRRRQQLGGVAEVTERWHVIAGNWFGAAYYQRLVGHWAHTAPLREAGLDPTRELTYAQLAQALGTRSGLAGAPPGGSPGGWGIGAADTPDVDTWCWGVIHSFGGALADRSGTRVVLASAETTDALAWMADTLDTARAIGALPLNASGWSDGEKNAAFWAGQTAYTSTRHLLNSSGSAPTAPPSVAYLAAPAGPAARARAVEGGAVWYLPRGVAPDTVERLFERLLEVPQQRRLWEAGRGVVLPAYEFGWNDPALSPPVAAAPGGEPSVHRFRSELAPAGFVSASGTNGPETAASLAIAEARLAARMLRAVLGGRPAAAVIAEAQQAAVSVFRDHGLPGA